MEGFPDISIIGPGKVGTALGALAVRAGLPVVAVAGGAPGKAEAAAEFIGGQASPCSPAIAAGVGGLVLLTVPDDRIQLVCQELAQEGAFAAGAVVAHCCGMLSSDILRPAADCCGCLIGSIHPLQTFPTVQAAVEKLPGTWCFCEGDEEAVEVLHCLAEAIGTHPVRIDPGGKVLYHAAAVMACNYLVALLDAAVSLARRAGVDERRWLEASGPMLRAAVDNVLGLGPAEALTGPIARGDVETIRRHAAALGAADRGLRRLYAAAGLQTVELALRKGSLRRPQAAEIRKILEDLDLRENP